MIIESVLISLLISIAVSYALVILFRLPRQSLYYLAFLPGTILSFESLHLIVAFILGGLIYALLKKHRLLYACLPFLFIFFLAIIFKLNLHFSSDQILGTTNYINSQRGEHIGTISALTGKLMHNKTSFIYPFLTNIENAVSPAAIFTHFHSKHLNMSLPLGFLFPWDIVLLVYFISQEKKSTPFRWLPGIFILFLLLLLGFHQNTDFQWIISSGIAISIAIYLSGNLAKLRKPIFPIILILNYLFILSYLSVITFSKFYF